MHSRPRRRESQPPPCRSPKPAEPRRKPLLGGHDLDLGIAVADFIAHAAGHVDQQQETARGGLLLRCGDRQRRSRDRWRRRRDSRRLTLPERRLTHHRRPQRRHRRPVQIPRRPRPSRHLPAPDRRPRPRTEHPVRSARVEARGLQALLNLATRRTVQTQPFLDHRAVAAPHPYRAPRTAPRAALRQSSLPGLARTSRSTRPTRTPSCPPPGPPRRLRSARTSAPPSTPSRTPTARAGAPLPRSRSPPPSRTDRPGPHRSPAPQPGAAPLPAPTRTRPRRERAPSPTMVFIAVSSWSPQHPWARTSR